METELNKEMYADAQTLAHGIQKWLDAANDQNGNRVEINRCLYEVRLRCSQLNNIVLSLEKN